MEVGPGKDGARDLERLQDRLAARLWGREGATARAGRMGEEAGAVVARLGADAVAGYHRLEAPLAPLPPPPDPWGASYAQRPARQPVGALSLVAADGAVGWFPWGGPGAELDASALVNAAEAIDALLAALAGDAGEDG